MLIGRTAELAVLDEAIAGLARSRPSIVTVSGDEGSGCSSLLAAAAERAEEAGVTVLAARGVRGAPAPPYSGLGALLRPIMAQVDAVADDSTAATLRVACGPTAKRTGSLSAVGVGLAVLRLLTAASDNAPVMVTIDDAGLLDGASVDAAIFALGQLGRDRVGAVVVSAPRGEQDPWMAVATHRVALGPLADRQLAAIVSDAVGCDAAPAAACARWAGGNPLLALELARSLTDDERHGRTPLPAVPRPGVRAAARMRERLEALEEPARRSVAVVAAGSETVATTNRALEVLGEPPGGLDAAEDAGIVRVTGDEVGFVHPLLQPLAYHLVAAASRRAAHRAIASVLVEPHQAVRRAWHLVASCSGPDEDAAGALDLVAGDARRRGALAESARALEQAAELSPDPGEARRRRSAAAAAWLDSHEHEAAMRLVTPDEDDLDAALLAVEAIERRNGPAAALAEVPADATTQADLFVALGRRADAVRALEDAADDGTLSRILAVALDPAAELPPAPARSGDAKERRAYRRWLDLAASRGTVVAEPATADELVAAATVDEAAGRFVEARGKLERAIAGIPTSAQRLHAELARRIVSVETAMTVEAGAPSASVLAVLTKAERRVAEAVAGGRTNREVADQLFVSVKTVDFHLQAIYRKLTVRSRTELAVLLAAGGDVAAPNLGSGANR